MSDPKQMLRVVLEQERRRGFQDSTVSGGLDGMLRGLHQGGLVAPGTPVHDILVETLAYPYRQLTPTMRERWVERTLAALSRPDRPRRERPAPPETPQAIRIGVTAPLAPGRRKAATTKGAAKRTPKAPAKIAKPVPRTLSLDSPATDLPNASRWGSRLDALNINTVRDLLYHLPHRYDDYSQIKKVNELTPGEEVTVIGDVWSCKEVTFGGMRKATEAIVNDGSGALRVVWFNQPYIARSIPVGARIVLSGKVSVFRGLVQMDAPEWELLEPGSDLSASVQAGRIAPVYPLTQGLALRTMRRLTRTALDRCLSMVEETLPEAVRRERGLMPLQEAFSQAHYPASHEAANAARGRLAYDELLTLQLAVLRRREERQAGEPAVSLTFPPEAWATFEASLPFPLTGAQQRVIGDVFTDIKETKAMARLLQGDVGSGKTVVAMAALLAAVIDGYQGSLMAPTEILAEQHFRTIVTLLDGHSLDGATAICRPAFLDREVHVALLRGGLGAKAKARAQAAISTGAVDIAIGTHALLQEGVEMPRLALAVVDEQHRFGVLQRTALRQKGGAAHLLVMTATPIPRTLALTTYGDLDVSVLDEMPPGRKPIRTVLIESGERNQAYNFVYEQIRLGRQAFIICPLVEESEAETMADVRAATTEFERLREEVFPELSLALLHGRMSAAQKDETMAAFRDHLVDVLVSTAVVEVGIDVPNANIIMIEGAERFGLAQLHQFRGRVGRGEAQSFCLLLSDSGSAEARERLRLMEEHQDGFRLAEEDLRLRGEGDVFGTRQSGLPQLKVAKLTDVMLLETARKDAAAVLGTDATLSLPEHEALGAAVARLTAGPGDVN
ncbi:MAG: ATP-dependent DNA helicase RecG [Dehalococcoidia bacterium]